MINSGRDMDEVVQRKLILTDEKHLIDFDSNFQRQKQRHAIDKPNSIAATACAYQIPKCVISVSIVRPVKMNRSVNADKTNARRIMAAVTICVSIRQLVFIVIVIKGTLTCAIVITITTVTTF